MRGTGRGCSEGRVTAASPGTCHRGQSRDVSPRPLRGRVTVGSGTVGAVTRDRSDEQDVVETALRRAAALADGDGTALRLLMHPDLQWTTFRGTVLDYEGYVASN